jgi:DNA-binding MarR family transcriptional regulator
MTTATIEDTLAHLQARGLRSVTDLRALIHLAGVEESTATNLAATVRVAPPTCTQMIYRLHAGGLLVRYNTLQDRRMVLVAITSTGRKLINPLLP